MFFAMWITRNGQQMWSGPYATKTVAEHELQRNLHARETGTGFVARGA